MLVAARGDIVTRQELRDRIWGRDTYVDFDRAINKAINHLRHLLGDDADRPRFIETLPKRGYRFLAGVSQSASRREIREEAREFYLKARYFWNKRTPNDLRRSIEYFRRAIERDPEYALAGQGWPIRVRAGGRSSARRADPRPTASTQPDGICVTD